MTLKSLQQNIEKQLRQMAKADNLDTIVSPGYADFLVSFNQESMKAVIEWQIRVIKGIILGWSTDKLMFEEWVSSGEHKDYSDFREGGIKALTDLKSLLEASVKEI